MWDSSDKSENAELILFQRSFSDKYAVLRTHKMMISFFDKEGSIVENREVLVKGVEKTVVGYDGRMDVRAILLNNQDYGFF